MREHIVRLEQPPETALPHAEMLVILCDGSGSNSSRQRIFKQDLMDLADRLGMRILVMHYPPYCSEFNPIEPNSTLF